MSGNLRLVNSEYLDKNAYANFIIANQIDQTKPSSIRKGLEEQLHAVISSGHFPTQTGS